MSNLAKYLPWIYKDFAETNALMDAEDLLFSNVEAEYDKGQKNQYILTADVDGIKIFEDMVGIIANPSTESLDFRRERLLNRYSTAPPFTMRFLERKLNEILGKDAWNAYLDYDNYTLYLETSANAQVWYHELYVTIHGIKPANIAFVNKPLIPSNILTNEIIRTGTLEWNYKLGTIWRLGRKPFALFTDKGVIKVATASSIKESLLNNLASDTASQIMRARINESFMIDAPSVSSNNNQVFVEYTIPASSGLLEINKIELLGANAEILAASSVYIPLTEDAVMKHVITMREG